MLPTPIAEAIAAIKNVLSLDQCSWVLRATTIGLKKVKVFINVIRIPHMNLFKSLENEDSIFKDERVFNQDYVPDEIIHREKEVKDIAYSLKGIVKGTGENVFLYGLTGTGKTSCARYVLKELREYSGKAIPIYLNCWNYSTRYSVLNQIAYCLDELVPRRGLAPDQLIEMITGVSKREERVPVVVLDEVDTLSKKGEDSVLYDLLRIGESLGGKIICILITNEYDFVAKLDRRIRSSFVQKSIQFVPYRPVELKDILKERAIDGLLPDTYNDEIIGTCAAFGARNKGDARVAIRLLWSAAKVAETKGKRKIEIEDIEEGKKQIKIQLEEEEKELLNNNDKIVLGELNKEWTSTSKLYEKINLDKRLIRMSIDRLEKFGFVQVRREGPTKSKLVRIKE